jgi:hypothetical protein
MTKQQFIEKFPIGKKVTLPKWIRKSPTGWLQVLFYGQESFFCISDQNIEWAYPYSWPWIEWLEVDRGDAG